MSTPLDIRAWGPHEASVPEALSAGARGFRPRSEAEWEWAFRRNPAGARLFLARRGGRLVAAYGAWPLRMRAFGEPRIFAQTFACLGCDAPDPEPWLATARAFGEAHIGPQKDLVHFGWPEGLELERTKNDLEHEFVQVATLLVRPGGDGPTEAPREVVELARFGPEFETLYVRCAGQWGGSTVRDATFLNWRFVDHPGFRYRILAVTADGVPRGYVVYRRGKELGADLGLLVDWLVTPGDEEAARWLVQGAVALARADGAPALALSMPEWSPWSLFVQEEGFRHRPTERLLFVRTALPRLDMLWLREHWWYTLADGLVT